MSSVAMPQLPHRQKSMKLSLDFLWFLLKGFKLEHVSPADVAQLCSCPCVVMHRRM